VEEWRVAGLGRASLTKGEARPALEAPAGEMRTDIIQNYPAVPRLSRSLPLPLSLSLSLSLNIFHSRKGFLSPGMEEVEAVGAPRTRVPAFSRAPQICQALHACLLDTGRLIALRRSVDTLARDAVAEPWERSR
jgi:hypothetical protein